MNGGENNEYKVEPNAYYGKPLVGEVLLRMSSEIQSKKGVKVSGVFDGAVFDETDDLNKALIGDIIAHIKGENSPIPPALKETIQETGVWRVNKNDRQAVEAAVRAAVADIDPLNLNKKK